MARKTLGGNLRSRRWWTETYGGLPRWVTAVIVVVVLVLAPMLGVALLNKNAAVANETQPTPTKTATPPTIAVIGDSYTAGVGTLASATDVDLSKSWTSLVEASTGYDFTNFAVKGSGYTIQGPYLQGVFGARVAAAVAANPDVIVFEGSINDIKTAATETETTVTSVLEKARSLTAVPCLVIGPVYVPSYTHKEVDVLNETMRRSADSANCTYADARAWVSVSNFYDTIHPNAAGYVEYAAAARKAIEPLVPAN